MRVQTRQRMCKRMLDLPHKAETLPGKGAQGLVPPSCLKRAEGHDAVLFHGDTRTRFSPPVGCGLQASGHHCRGGEEWGPGTGADSEEWSNSGLRTSISPVCENTGSSSQQQGKRQQDEEKPQQTYPPQGLWGTHSPVPDLGTHTR